MFIKWITNRDRFIYKSNSSNNYNYIPIEFHNERNLLRKNLPSLMSEGGMLYDEKLIEVIDFNCPKDDLMKLFDDDEFMLNCVSLNGTLLDHGSERIRKNYMICKLALNNNLTNYDYILNKDSLKLFKRDRLEYQEFHQKNENECWEIINKAIEKGKEIQFNWLPDSVLSSKKCALLLVSHFDCLHYFTKELKDDFDVVCASVRKNRSLQSVSERITSNKELVMQLLDLVPYVHPDGTNFLKHCSTNLKNDIEIVRKSINICAMEMSYTSNELKNELIYEAIDLVNKQYHDNDWNLFVFYNMLASGINRPFNNRKLLIKMLESSISAFEYASEELRNDPEIIKMTNKHSDKSFIIHIAKNNPILKDRSFIMETVSSNGLAIKYFREWVRNDPEVCLAAIKQNGQALRYVNNPTREMKIEAVKQNGFTLNRSDMFNELYQIRMNHEYGGDLYLPHHLIASVDHPFQVLTNKSVQNYSHHYYTPFNDL